MAWPGSARSPRGDPLGEVGQADLGAFGEDGGALDSVPQLAEVAGPGVSGQGLARASGVKPVSATTDPGRAKKVEQVVGQVGDVGPLAERG